MQIHPPAGMSIEAPLLPRLHDDRAHKEDIKPRWWTPDPKRSSTLLMEISTAPYLTAYDFAQRSEAP
jgi:hypothetical protein